MNYLAENIRAYCKAKGISVSTFAKECGFHQSLVNHWEKNANPSIKNMMAIEKYTGIPMSRWVEKKLA